MNRWQQLEAARVVGEALREVGDHGDQDADRLPGRYAPRARGGRPTLSTQVDPLLAGLGWTRRATIRPVRFGADDGAPLPAVSRVGCLIAPQDPARAFCSNWFPNRPPQPDRAVPRDPGSGVNPRRRDPPPPHRPRPGSLHRAQRPGRVSTGLGGRRLRSTDPPLWRGRCRRVRAVQGPGAGGAWGSPRSAVAEERRLRRQNAWSQNGGSSDGSTGRPGRGARRGRSASMNAHGSRPTRPAVSSPHSSKALIARSRYCHWALAART